MREHWHGMSPRYQEHNAAYNQTASTERTEGQNHVHHHFAVSYPKLIITCPKPYTLNLSKSRVYCIVFIRHNHSLIHLQHKWHDCSLAL
ncbi:hypothetical protein O181_022628 [Austropuccinia psidii MF-1]|uniref:Uncharacterized protein n=1 Tax=Austropuccinia psidii MF-1 TaxID=1389203 RepID=A0A9Q3CFJ1_9BASI|nr:hypothetical protein [Austropuccinia psidii MF-1]